MPSQTDAMLLNDNELRNRLILHPCIAVRPGDQPSQKRTPANQVARSGLPVCWSERWPSRSATAPFTITALMPIGYWNGFS